MEAPDEFLVCESAALVDSRQGVRFDVQVDGAREPAFAVRYRGHVHAYVNRCAHIAYELDFQPGNFFDSTGTLLICSTHGAVYEPENGRCAGGPCSRRGLLPVPVSERDGKVYAKHFSRSERSQRRSSPSNY
jgi:nitrite reductase/ring-hydroxylating ferredoxin subunit